MQEFLNSLSNKAVELVIAGITILILAIGRVVFMKERKAIQAEFEERKVVTNAELKDMMESLDRSMIQRFESMRREIERHVIEKGKEDTRQFERLHDRFNNLKKD